MKIAAAANGNSPKVNSLQATTPKKKAGKARVWKPTNSQFYHMEFWYKGRRHTGTTKKTNRVDAVAFAKDAYERAVAEFVNFDPRLSRDMTFGEAVSLYFEERGQHVATPDHLEKQLYWLLDKVGDGTLLSQIDDVCLAKVMAEKKKEYRWGRPQNGHVSNLTVNHVVLDLIRLILRKARIDWKIPLPDEPNYRRHRLKFSKRRVELSIAQENAFVAARPDDYGPLMEFGLHTGLRKRDLLLRWDQIDWDHNHIKVRTKNEQDHEVRMTPTIRAMLMAQRGRHPEFVWTYVCRRTTRLRTGELLIPGTRYPVTYGTFSGAFQSMKKETGIQNRRIHDLRKTAGARMHRITGDLVAVQELLGHANISLTRDHYINITPDDVERRMVQTEIGMRQMKERALLDVDRP